MPLAVTPGACAGGALKQALPPAPQPEDELPALVALLQATQRRIEELTTAKVDAVQGKGWLLPSARQATILDALPAQIGLLDLQGRLVSVNRAWRASQGGGSVQRQDLGLNYVELFEAAKGAQAEDTSRIAAGIRSVLAGTVERFFIEYAEDSGRGRFWFQFVVTPLAGRSLTGAVVMRLDITELKAASAQLAESQLRLSLATDSARIGIWDLDPTTNQLYWDARMYELYGIESSSFSGAYEAWRNGLLPQDRERAEAELAKAVAGNEEFHTEFRISWPNGEIRFIEAHAVVCRASDGSPSRVIGTNWDITARKQTECGLREWERRFSDLLRDVELASVMLDLEGRVTFCNPYLLRLTGWQHEEVIGRNWFQMFTPGQYAETEGAFAQLLANVPEAWYRENEVVTRSGERRLIRWSNSVLRSWTGAVIGSASIGEDITERKLAERKLERSLQELRARNTELNEFAYIASHDLQEPLRKVRMLADRLEHGHVGQTDVKGRDYLARMAAAAQRMQSLIDDLLCYSTVLHNGTFACVDLNHVVGCVIDDLNAHLRECEGQIHVRHLPDAIWGDASQLRQLFRNLLANALKYRAADRPPRIQVEAQAATIANEAAGWRIEVSDNGIGFDNAQSERIFAPFQRLHGHSEYPGTGIGLAITRRIADHHGGSVRASSVLGQGSCFEVLLPKCSSADCLRHALS